MVIGLFIFILGAVIGSFLNVVIFRYNTGESIITKRSRCFSCNKHLSWFELIPIFSFLIQRGRCRGCRSKISWQYPAVEFFVGLLFLIIAWKLNFQPGIKLLYYWCVVALLMVIAVYDFRHQIIPDFFVYLFDVLALVNLFGNWNLLLYGFLSGILFFSFFAALWLVSKGRWMGFADAKLALGIGWLLGFGRGLVSILLAFWIGAIFSVFLLFFISKKFTLKSRIPFGPFLILGAIISFLFGGELIQFYFNAFKIFVF